MVETPEQAEERRRKNREWYAKNLEERRLKQLAYNRKKRGDEPLPDLNSMPEAKREMFKRIMVALLADRHKKRMEYCRNWKRAKHNYSPRVPAEPKPEKAKRVPLTEDEKRLKHNAYTRRYRSNPVVRERVNEKKRIHSSLLFEQANGDPVKLAELRVERRIKVRGWLDRMRSERPAEYAEYRKSQSAKEKFRRATNPQRRIACALRTKVYKAIRLQQGGNKSANTETLTGCSIEDFMSHLESMWKPGMSWSNFGRGVGKWTLDHTQPCASVDLTDPENQKKVFHYSNIEPMWFVDNCSKNSHWSGKRWRHSDHACKPDASA